MRSIRKYVKGLNDKVKRLRAITITLIAFVLGLFLWYRQRSASVVLQTVVPSVSSAVSPSLTPRSLQMLATHADTDRLQMPGGPYVSSDPRWAIVRNRDRVDHNWEWKTAINFYGRVVDEGDRAVPGAHVAFSWTDLSSEGNSHSATASDGSGTFSLEGKAGRVLQVDVSKEGYYKVRNERLRSFDYAGFSLERKST